VVPGHFVGASDYSPQSVGFTVDYIRTFEAQARAANDSAALVEAMKRRYPGLGDESALALSAKVAKGEMQWPLQ